MSIFRKLVRWQKYKDNGIELFKSKETCDEIIKKVEKLLEEMDKKTIKK